MLKERVTELKSIRDQARAAEGSLKTFASQARRRMRTELGGYRRDHLRALAERVEVDTKDSHHGVEKRALRTLVAASSAKTADFGVPSFVPKWRARRDSNS